MVCFLMVSGCFLLGIYGGMNENWVLWIMVMSVNKGRV